MLRLLAIHVICSGSFRFPRLGFVRFKCCFETLKHCTGVQIIPGPKNYLRTASDPQIGLQMILRPEIIPANCVAKNRNGMDSINSLWISIFLILLSDEESTIKKGKSTLYINKINCLNVSFRKHTTKTNMNPGRWLLILWLSFFFALSFVLFYL